MNMGNKWIIMMQGRWIMQGGWINEYGKGQWENDAKEEYEQALWIEDEDVRISWICTNACRD